MHQALCKVQGTQRKQPQPQVLSASIQSMFTAMSEPSPFLQMRRVVKSGQREQPVNHQAEELQSRRSVSFRL